MKKNCICIHLAMVCTTLCSVTAFAFTLPSPIGFCLAAPSEPILGAPPNAVPFADTFDQYPNDFVFVTPTNGWLASSDDHSYAYSYSALLESGRTSDSNGLFSGQCLVVSTEGKQLVNATTGTVDNLWIDLSTIMTPSEDYPVFATPPLFAVVVNAETNLAVYSGITNVFLASDRLIALDQVNRLTIQIAYSSLLEAPYFCVSVNRIPVQWNQGRFLPGSSTAQGGAWLPCATTNRHFYGVAFYGYGIVDALRISDTYLGPDMPAGASIEPAVAVSWPSDYGRFYRVEVCDNLSTGSWQFLGDKILGTGATNTVFDAVGAQGQRFYRVKPAD